MWPILKYNGRGGVSFDIDIDYWRLTFDLSIDVEKLWVVVVGVGVP